jgi:hypothetical protein
LIPIHDGKTSLIPVLSGYESDNEAGHSIRGTYTFRILATESRPASNQAAASADPSAKRH